MLLSMNENFEIIFLMLPCTDMKIGPSYKYQGMLRNTVTDNPVAFFSDFMSLIVLFNSAKGF